MAEWVICTMASFYYYDQNPFRVYLVIPKFTTYTSPPIVHLVWRPPPPPPPPQKKNCRSNVINFSWYHCNTQEKLETKFILWEICKRRICKTLKDSGRSSKIMSSLIWPIAKFVTNLLSVLCFYVLCLLAKKHSTETNQVTSSTGN